MKRIFKKAVCALAAVLLLFSCGACGTAPSRAPGGTADDGTIEPLEERTNVEYALCGTDALGREISPAGKTNGKLVGLFYTLWLGNDFSETGEPRFDGIYDMSKMKRSVIYSGGGSPFVKMHFYAEPLFGYYNQCDAWVTERHVQMFIAAGIDFLAIDATNTDYYPQPLTVLLDTLESYRTAGYRVPKILFLTNTNSHERVTEIYEFLYRENRYQALWFCDGDEGRNPDGKPWITMRAEEKAYLDQEIAAAFYFRDSQWPNEAFKENGLPWIEFTRPQPVHNGIISVSVAQNSGMHMSNSVQFERSPNGIDYYNSNWGRGYTSAAGCNDKSKVDEGANFQEQWDAAIRSGARIAFILEWNEWAALKLAAEVEGIGNTVVFFDCVTPEFSRDIEPINGYYGDNFYMQMIQNIRAFRGQSGDGISVETAELSPTEITGAWNRVSSGIADFSGSETRNYANCDGSAVYTNTTKRNDITEIRVAACGDKVYVLLTAAQKIAVSQDADWMNLWIRTSAHPENACGYDFVINRSRNEETADIEKLTADGAEIVGSAALCVRGNLIQYSFDRSLLGAWFQLKATDHVDPAEDLLSLYTTGDSAPYGRLNYLFRF